MSVDCSRVVSWICALACAMGLTACAAISPPLTNTEINAFTVTLTNDLNAPSLPTNGTITLDDAVARAIRFNHSIRAKELEAAVAEAKVRADSGDMLPSIVAETDFYRRDRPLLSRSNYSTGFATSSDTKTVSRDIALSWNILDLGLSYVRAKQGIDKAHQQQEESRRVTARIVEETRSLFWRAIALEKLAPALGRLDREVNEALKLSRLATQDLQIDPMAQITFQRELLNLQRDLNQLDAGLSGTTDQLKVSIGLPVTDKIKLVGTPSLITMTTLNDSAESDVNTALNQRAEIRQHIYDLRISADEIDATILQLLPGITLSRNFAKDSNSFLYHSNWISWGTRIAGNLVNLIRLPAELNLINAQSAAQRQNALATAATVVVQVHMARARIVTQRRAYRDAERFAQAQRQLLNQVQVAVRLGKVGQQALTREKLASLQANVRAILAFADLHAAYAMYATARGDDPSQLLSSPALSPCAAATTPCHHPPSSTVASL
jgi:outer membrane protein TolC